MPNRHNIFTSWNEILTKLIFLHLSVILLTGGSTWLGTLPGTTHLPRPHMPPMTTHAPWD